MSMAIAAEGAPFSQGRSQGSGLRDEIESAVTELRRRYGSLAWMAARRHAHRTAHALASFVPQQYERLEGIARGAGVPLRSLELMEEVHRAEGLAAVWDGEIHASFDPVPEIESQLRVRRSAPDAGAVPSVELTAAAWTGCLAGVNAEGIALACLRDPGRGGPSLRVLAQDLLQHARALGPGIDHLRRRATYLGSDGVLLLVDASGEVLRAELRSGELQTSIPPSSGVAPLKAMLRILPATRTLHWLDARGGEYRLRAG